MLHVMVKFCYMQYEFNCYIQVSANFISISNIVVRACLKQGANKERTNSRAHAHTHTHTHTRTPTIQLIFVKSNSSHPENVILSS